MEPGYSLHCFRKDSRNRKPCWERYPKGGSWTLDLPLELNGKDVADDLWHRLVQGVLSEAFHDTRVVGIVASRRSSKFCISVWHRNCVELDIEAFAGRINEVMGVDSDTLLYKPFKEALADGSTRWKAHEYRLAVGPDGHHHQRSPAPSEPGDEPDLVLHRESPAERLQRQEEGRHQQSTQARRQQPVSAWRKRAPPPAQLDISPNASPVTAKRPMALTSQARRREDESERKLAELAMRRLSFEPHSPTSPGSPLSPRSPPLGTHQHPCALKPLVYPFPGGARPMASPWHGQPAVCN